MKFSRKLGARLRTTTYQLGIPLLITEPTPSTRAVGLAYRASSRTGRIERRDLLRSLQDHHFVGLADHLDEVLREEDEELEERPADDCRRIEALKFYARNIKSSFVCRHTTMTTSLDCLPE